LYNFKVLLGNIRYS